MEEKMKKLVLSTLAIASFLLLAGCSHSDSTAHKGPSKAEIQATKVKQAGKKLKATPTDKNYEALLKAELGAKHVVAIKTAENGYQVAKITGYKLKQAKEYKAFSKAIRSTFAQVKQTKYTTKGLGFVQKGKDDFTQFTFAYSAKSIASGEPKQSAFDSADNAITPIFDAADSYYIEPIFGSDNDLNPDYGTTENGPLDQQKRSLNSFIMEAFD